jgi:hypothetical protein
LVQYDQLVQQEKTEPTEPTEPIEQMEQMELTETHELPDFYKKEYHEPHPTEMELHGQQQTQIYTTFELTFEYEFQDPHLYQQN